LNAGFCIKLKEKIPDLSIYLAKKLAKQFDMTGGDIENIARKVVMNKVLSNNDVKESLIMDFCKSEKLNPGKINSIGFKKNL